jgi:hypothetical protein
MSQITSDILVWGCDKYGQLGIDDQFLDEQYDFDNGKRPSFHPEPIPHIARLNGSDGETHNHGLLTFFD